jgi:hypothetical protein
VALKVPCIVSIKLKSGRNQHPESSLWESEVGSDWLRGDCNKECESQLDDKSRKIVAGLDETFFSGFMILVLLGQTSFMLNKMSAVG